MAVEAIRNITDELDLFDRISSLAFFSTLPLVLPCLDALHEMLLSAQGPAPAVLSDNAAFLWSMPLAAMFTALSILFVCLLKTSYNRLGVVLVRASGGAYLLGYAGLVAAIAVPNFPDTALTFAGLLLGFGLAVLSLSWARRLHLSDFRSAFIALIIALFTSTLLNMGLLFISPVAGIAAAFVLACIGTLGALRGYKRRGFQAPDSNTEGSNWWDVFGKADVSLLEGTDDFQAPASRILFFVVTPLIMLLLFIVNRGLPVDLPEPFTPAMIGCLLVAPCAVPLLFIKSDQALINASCRLYLPLMAFCVFAINSFMSPTIDDLVVQVGIDVFCTLYALIMAAMIIAMAGRMRSLVLPAGSLILIAISLVSLLSYSKVDAGALITWQYYALLALFVLAVAMLLATPGSRMWRMMLEGVAQNADAGDLSVSYTQRCEAVAQEYNLTARETEILSYLGRGYSASYVAEILVVAESTVRSHRKNIYHKLGINSREELLELLDYHNVEEHGDSEGAKAH